MNDGTCQRELPKYKSHKVVWALKIAKIQSILDEAEIDTGAKLITPADDGYAQFTVGVDFVNKHNPEVGGYFVRYADGYTSYSPAKAFEEGYTRI